MNITLDQNSIFSSTPQFPYKKTHLPFTYTCPQNNINPLPANVENMVSS